MISELMTFVGMIYLIFLAISYKNNNIEWAIAGTIIFFIGMIIILFCKATVLGYLP